MVRGTYGPMTSVLWLMMSLKWRSEMRKGPRKGSTMCWVSSYVQPPNCPASLGNPARTSLNHLPTACNGSCAEGGVFEEQVILNRSCLLHWPLYLGLDNPVCYEYNLYVIMYLGKLCVDQVVECIDLDQEIVARCGIGDLQSCYANLSNLCCAMLCCMSSVAFRLCCAVQTPWLQDSLGQLAARVILQMAPTWSQQLHCLCGLAFA